MEHTKKNSNLGSSSSAFGAYNSIDDGKVLTKSPVDKNSSHEQAPMSIEMVLQTTGNELNLSLSDSNNPTLAPVSLTSVYGGFGSGRDAPLNLSRSATPAATTIQRLSNHNAPEQSVNFELSSVEPSTLGLRRKRSATPHLSDQVLNLKISDVKRNSPSQLHHTPLQIPQRSANNQPTESGFGYVVPFHKQNVQKTISRKKWIHLTSCDSKPSNNIYRGLPQQTIEGTFSDILMKQLEENYNERRPLVIGRNEMLMTPSNFLKVLFHQIGVDIQYESILIQDSNNILQRTEIYAGNFCGVAHAENKGLSEQLAAAHLLEKVRIHFGFDSTWKTQRYALHPGSRLTKMEKTLKDLCKQYEFEEPVFSSKQLHNSGQTEPKFIVTCKVRSLTTEAACDDRKFGRYVAAMRMYEYFAQPQDIPVVQINDYIRVGGDCPELKDILPCIALHQPDPKTFEWKKKNHVKDIDNVLHDPTNECKYLTRGTHALRAEVQNTRQDFLIAAQFIADQFCYRPRSGFAMRQEVVEYHGLPTEQMERVNSHQQSRNGEGMIGEVENDFDFSEDELEIFFDANE